jgi:large subunit ribosomal protein L20
MPRSVNHVASKARKKKILKLAKGYFGRRKNVWTVAKNAVEKGLGYAYRDRKQKKRNVRSVWIVRINAAVREFDMSYSEFIGKLNAKNITLSRKALADLALNHPEAFKAIVNEVKDATPVSRPDNAPRVRNVVAAPAAKAKAPAAEVAAPKAKAPKAPKAEVAEEVKVEEVTASEDIVTPAGDEEAPVKKARATKAKKEETTEGE